MKLCKLSWDLLLCFLLLICYGQSTTIDFTLARVAVDCMFFSSFFISVVSKTTRVYANENLYCKLESIRPNDPESIYFLVYFLSTINLLHTYLTILTNQFPLHLIRRA